MRLSFHYLLAGLTGAAFAGGAVALAANSISPQKTPSLPQNFTAADEAVFSHEFRTASGVCDVGLAERDICFDRSPLETRIVKGEPFPQHMYPLSLEWRAKLAMTRKATELKTVRIGRTIALVNRETGMVADTMYLGEQPQTEMVQTERAAG
ncbi:hypothetical protein [Henriciella sp.]|uniref:hypothetical protein n=1 Tax=Henriciella sp. TaxID=1968823 RepID=UPI002639571B|nr:hypothetical protein [Henriciella sp.]